MFHRCPPKSVGFISTNRRSVTASSPIGSRSIISSNASPWCSTNAGVAGTTFGSARS